MTYEIFKETLIAELKGHFPPDTCITVHPIPRNNHLSTDGLTILEAGFHIAPTIYIREYYARLQKDSDFSAVLKDILNTYYRCRPTENINPSFFQEFSNVRQRIVYKLIHYEKNRELLTRIPHIPFLDLAIVFYFLVSSTPAGTATILVQNDHLKLWHTDKQQLYLLARQNTPFLLSSHFEQLSSMLEDISREELPITGDAPAAPDDTSGLPECCTFPIYVLTNEKRFLGAACLLYDELLKELALGLNTDFYIIPSSIHEVLLIPALSSMKKSDFNDMIREVNHSQLEPEDILSDHVYYYSRAKNQIII